MQNLKGMLFASLGVIKRPAASIDDLPSKRIITSLC